MTPSPTRQRMQQILASIGSRPAEDTPKIEAAEYNWHQPHCFNVAQLKKLDAFTKSLAKGCTGKFSRLYNSDFDVTINSATQHFASEFTGYDNVKGNYYISFGDEKQAFGLIAIPGKTAINWTRQLLGDSGNEHDTDKNLSQLEYSLLLDITDGLVATISESFNRNDLKSDGEIVTDKLPMELQGTEELCKITFATKKQDSEISSEAYFLIFCEKLEQVVGKNEQSGKSVLAEDTSKTMLDHVNKLHVSLTAKLACAVLSFEELMDLQAGDVLLLDKKVNEPIELIVEDKTVFRGTPARSAGKYATVITEKIN